MAKPHPLDEALSLLRTAVTQAEEVLAARVADGANLTDQAEAAADVYAARTVLARQTAAAGSRAIENAATTALSALLNPPPTTEVEETSANQKELA